MYREDYKMVESACGLGCLVLGWFFGVFVPFSTICLSSLPSTMTWAPCPHGVRTRGKKQWSDERSMVLHLILTTLAGRRCSQLGRQSTHKGRSSCFGRPTWPFSRHGREMCQLTAIKKGLVLHNGGWVANNTLEAATGHECFFMDIP